MKLPFGLKYRLNATPDLSFERSTAYENVFDFGLRNNMVSNMQEYRYNHNNFLIEHLLSFDRNFEKQDRKSTRLTPVTSQSRMPSSA